ncbi:hypothetical protein DL93DRAFT_2078622 [Clavulina sp. PMI_390]|nr:hypothetical protein DL93DRAFT_2078622 [Clavulina sp. PMI_390]
MSLLVTIFLIVLLTEVIEWIGKPVLQQLCFGLYQSLTSDLRKRQDEIKKALLNDQREMKATSSVDQFAKWAKLRRKVDKGAADLEKINAEVAAEQTSFGVKFNSAVWFLTSGLQFAIAWWYRKQAVFYLPPGWFGPLEWWLALPFAPRGSVSCATWQMACRRTIKMFETLVRQAVLEPLVLRAAMQTAAPVPNVDEKAKSTT